MSIEACSLDIEIKVTKMFALVYMTPDTLDDGFSVLRCSYEGLEILSLNSESATCIYCQK